MNSSITDRICSPHEAPCSEGKYPVDQSLLAQNKCRTQALKQLLAMPAEPVKGTSRNWRLTYIIGELLSRFHSGQA